MCVTNCYNFRYFSFVTTQQNLYFFSRCYSYHVDIFYVRSLIVRIIIVFTKIKYKVGNIITFLLPLSTKDKSIVIKSLLKKITYNDKSVASNVLFFNSDEIV